LKLVGILAFVGGRPNYWGEVVYDDINMTIWFRPVGNLLFYEEKWVVIKTKPTLN